jgi:arabinose-5-phosphate isomerase
MHSNPRTIRVDALAVEAAEMMEQSRVTSILVIDEAGCLCGSQSFWPQTGSRIFVGSGS